MKKSTIINNYLDKLYQARIARRIKRQNAAFNRMTPAQQRVVIAKDCIDWIRAGQFRGRCGVIVEQDLFEYGSVKDQLLQSELACDVCAKGGLFLSYIARVNEFDYTPTTNMNSNTRGTKNMKVLSKLFDWNQLNLIETAFEGNVCVGRSRMKIGDIRAAEEFYENSHGSSGYRLIQICENIIKNKGTFIP